MGAAVCRAGAGVLRTVSGYGGWPAVPGKKWQALPGKKKARNTLVVAGLTRSRHTRVNR